MNRVARKMDKHDYRLQKINPDDLKINKNERLRGGGFGDVYAGNWNGHKIDIKAVLTPPYSLLRNIDPTDISTGTAEYHQWSFSVSKFQELFEAIVLTAKLNIGILPINPPIPESHGLKQSSVILQMNIVLISSL